MALIAALSGPSRHSSARPAFIATARQLHDWFAKDQESGILTDAAALTFEWLLRTGQHKPAFGAGA